MNNKKEPRLGVALYRRVRRSWNLLFWNWTKTNLESLKSITYGLYQYLFGWTREHRPYMKRTKARWFFGESLWVMRDFIDAPRFECRVCDGMGEHYGYPRHYARFVISWNHHGYAFGVDFSAPSNVAGQPRDTTP